MNTDPITAILDILEDDLLNSKPGEPHKITIEFNSTEELSEFIADFKNSLNGIPVS